MRKAVIAGLALASVVGAGCSSVGFSTGVPVLTKNGRGILVSETAGPPDLERGRHARLAGRPAEALLDLKPLAEAGYADAMTVLAATYLDFGTVDSRLEAEKWYRRALKTRPDAGLSLARLLIGYGKRTYLPEINALIDDAVRRGNEEVDSVKLQRYIQFPDLSTPNDGDIIAERGLKSALVSVQIQSLIWLRQNIATGNNAGLLEQNCRKLLSVEPACYIDLAHFYRYQRKQEQLENIVDAALLAFASGTNREEQIDDSARLYQPPTQFESLAGRLAAAMVDEINETNDGDVPEQEGVAAATGQPDLDFEDDDFEGTNPKAPSAADVSIATFESKQALAPASTSAGGNAISQNVELANKILRWMIAQGGEFSVEAAIVAVRYPFLLPDLDLEATLRPAADAKYPAAVSALADLLFSSQRIATRRPTEAIALYKQCLGYVATEMRANARLGRAYSVGILGDPDPQLALSHYLKAARAGSSQSYASLARMFLGMSGIRVNRINGYVFAKRSEDAGRPLMMRIRKLKRLNELKFNLESADMFEVLQVKLLDQVVSEMTQAELAEAQSLYQMERAIQPVLRQPIPSDIYTRGQQ